MGDDIFSTPLPFDYKEKAVQINPEEFEKIVTSRRSVRVYSDRKVPQETMRKCLDLALLAPNSSNLQPWQFFWVRNLDKKQQLIHACFDQPAAKTAAELVVFVARIDRWDSVRKQMVDLFNRQAQSVPKSARDYYEKLVPLVYNVGIFGIMGCLRKLLFSVVGLFRPVPREPSSKSDLKNWATKTCALACENFMLAARAYGFDTCPMEGMDSTRVRKLLGLPRSASIVMVISIGERAANGVYGPRIRMPKEQFVIEV